MVHVLKTNFSVYAYYLVFEMLSLGQRILPKYEPQDNTLISSHARIRIKISGISIIAV